MARNGPTKVIYKGIFISKQTLEEIKLNESFSKCSGVKEIIPNNIERCMYEVTK